MIDRKETPVEKFLDYVGIVTQTISRRELGNVMGPANVERLYELFAAAWQEVYPDYERPEVKP